MWLKNFRRKVVPVAKKLASKNVRCSQNPLFKLLPVNFWYDRTSVRKSKNFGLGHLSKPQLGVLKKKLPN
jgi:hypothetical protein